MTYRRDAHLGATYCIRQFPSWPAQSHLYSTSYLVPGQSQIKIEYILCHWLQTVPPQCTGIGIAKNKHVIREDQCQHSYHFVYHACNVETLMARSSICFFCGHKLRHFLRRIETLGTGMGRKQPMWSLLKVQIFSFTEWDWYKPMQKSQQCRWTDMLSRACEPSIIFWNHSERKLPVVCSFQILNANYIHASSYVDCSYNSDIIILLNQFTLHLFSWKLYACQNFSGHWALMLKAI